MEQNGAVQHGDAARVAMPAAPEPPTAAAPTKLEEADRLGVENIYLRLTNLKLQIDLLDSQKKEAGMQMLRLQDEMRKKQVELSAKYGMSIEPTTVNPDGTLKPRVPAAPPPTMVQAKLSDGTPVSIPASALAGDGAIVRV